MSETPPIDAGEKIIYQVDVTPKNRDADIFTDVPEAYCVVAHGEMGGCGIVVWSLYRGNWHANCSARWLVRHLLEKVEKLEKTPLDNQKRIG